MELVLTLSVGLVIASIFYLIRNEFVHDVRVAFINGGGCRDGTYDALPSYEAMLYEPRYWTLWTEAHWRAWVARRGLAQEPK